jgi:3-hydroxyisobutyrate dehydrogenase
MTGKLLYMGPEPERAASFKLLGNEFLMFVTAGLADFFTLAKALGIEAKDASALFDSFNPGMLVPMRVQRILAANFADPSWELQMARKDARLMMEAAAAAGSSLSVLPSIAALMDRFIGEGHAREDWTIIART